MIDVVVNDVNNTQHTAAMKKALIDYCKPSNLEFWIQIQGGEWICAKTLNANDRVCIEFDGTFHSLDDPARTYFEGRLIYD